MDRKVVELISNIVPSTALRKALYSGEYDDAIDIIANLMDEIDDFPDDIFAIFDYFYWAIEDNNNDLLKLGFEKIGRLYFLEKIWDLLECYIQNDEINETELQIQMTLNWYPIFLNADIDSIVKELLALKEKKYPKVEHLNEVLTMPFSSEDDRNVKCSFLEGLLNGNEIGYEEVTDVLLKNDPDSLMEKIKVIAYLRETYMQLKQPDIDLLKQMLDEVTKLELKRKDQ